MIITKGKISDINDIFVIIDQAKEFLKEQNINQWQDNYPNINTITEDIELDRLYVVKENDLVVGLFVVVEYEPTYDVIYDGSWYDDSPYIAVHRIAVLNDYKGKGVANCIFNYLKQKYNHIRVDTHRNNINMQRCLIKNNFKYCGIIYLNKNSESDKERLAYEYF